MAAPAISLAVAYSGVTTNTQGWTLPAVDNGDIILIVANYSNSSGTIPSSWSQTGGPEFTNLANLERKTSAGVVRGKVSLWWRRCDGTEDGQSVTLVHNGATGNTTHHGKWAAKITGCITTGDPWDTPQYNNPNYSSTVDWPAITPSGDERSLLTCLFSPDDSPLSTTPTNWTLVEHAGSGSGTDGAVGAYKRENVTAAGGPYDPANQTISQTNQFGFVTFQIAFKPPAGGVTMDAVGTMTPSALGAAAYTSQAVGITTLSAPMAAGPVAEKVAQILPSSLGTFSFTAQAIAQVSADSPASASLDSRAVATGAFSALGDFEIIAGEIRAVATVGMSALGSAAYASTSVGTSALSSIGTAARSSTSVGGITTSALGTAATSGTSVATLTASSPATSASSATSVATATMGAPGSAARVSTAMGTVTMSAPPAALTWVAQAIGVVTMQALGDFVGGGAMTSVGSVSMQAPGRAETSVAAIGTIAPSAAGTATSSATAVGHIQIQAPMSVSPRIAESVATVALTSQGTATLQTAAVAHIQMQAPGTSTRSATSVGGVTMSSTGAASLSTASVATATFSSPATIQTQEPIQEAVATLTLSALGTATRDLRTVATVNFFASLDFVLGAYTPPYLGDTPSSTITPVRPSATIGDTEPTATVVRRRPTATIERT